MRSSPILFVLALAIGCVGSDGEYSFGGGGGPLPGDDGTGGDGAGDDGTGDDGAGDGGADGGDSGTSSGDGGVTGDDQASSDEGVTTDDSTGSTGDGGTTGDAGTTGDPGTTGDDTTTSDTGGAIPGCGASWDFADCNLDPWLKGNIGGALNSWACGDPGGVGPPGPNTGMWATNLYGNYNAQEGSYIQAPMFSLADCVGSVTMTITHWYDFAGGAHCTPFCDGGVVYISNNGGATWTYLTPTPNDYYTVWPIGSMYTPPDGMNGYRDSSGGWTTSTFDLSPYIGADEVSVRFILGGPSLGIYPVAPGWYIDQVTIQ